MSSDGQEVIHFLDPDTGETVSGHGADGGDRNPSASTVPSFSGSEAETAVTDFEGDGDLQARTRSEDESGATTGGVQKARRGTTHRNQQSATSHDIVRSATHHDAHLWEAVFHRAVCYNPPVPARLALHGDEGRAIASLLCNAILSVVCLMLIVCTRTKSRPPACLDRNE